ncbi:MAG: hypothetical protein WCK15_22835 [Pirellula sp.]
MEIKKFKKLFAEFSSNILLQRHGKFWLFQASMNDECKVRISLQDSNWSKKFYVNIEIFILGLFEFPEVGPIENTQAVGHLFRREPPEYAEVFDLESSILDSERELRLRDFFSKFLQPFLCSVVTIAGITEQEKRNELHVFPAVKAQMLKMRVDE